MTPPRPELEALLDWLAAELAERVQRQLARAQWVAQAESPLGRRRHIGAVRRRVAVADPGARIMGRRYLLRPEAVDEELLLLGRRSVAKAEPRDELAEELGLRVVARP
jgi:hypothetical protein